MINNKFQKYLPQVIQLLKKHKVRNAYLFGSAVTEKFNEKSDIDLIIKFDDALDPLEKGELMWNLEFALEDMLHRKIDLIQESTPKNPYFIKEINETKTMIHGK